MERFLRGCDTFPSFLILVPGVRSPGQVLVLLLLKVGMGLGKNRKYRLKTHTSAHVHEHVPTAQRTCRRPQTHEAQRAHVRVFRCTEAHRHA